MPRHFIDFDDTKAADGIGLIEKLENLNTLVVGANEAGGSAIERER